MPIDPKKRGLASATPETRARVSSKGGKTITPKSKLKGFGSPNHPNRKKHA